MEQKKECKIQVYFWNRNDSKLLIVNNIITIGDIIKMLDGNEKELVVFNDGDTPLIDYNKNLVDYNLWFPEDKSYIAKIYLYKIEDTHLYNKELLDAYKVYELKN